MAHACRLLIALIAAGLLTLHIVDAWNIKPSPVNAPHQDPEKLSESDVSASHTRLFKRAVRDQKLHFVAPKDDLLMTCCSMTRTLMTRGANGKKKKSSMEHPVGEDHHIKNRGTTSEIKRSTHLREGTTRATCPKHQASLSGEPRFPPGMMNLRTGTAGASLLVGARRQTLTAIGAA